MTSDALDRAAKAAHDAYEQAATVSGWDTQEVSRVPWSDVPPSNRAATCAGVAAALQVMADDLRELCARQDWRGNGHMVYARDIERIIDAYVGEQP